MIHDTFQRIADPPAAPPPGIQHSVQCSVYLLLDAFRIYEADDVADHQESESFTGFGSTRSSIFLQNLDTLQKD